MLGPAPRGKNKVIVRSRGGAVNTVWAEARTPHGAILAHILKCAPDPIFRSCALVATLDLEHLSSPSACRFELVTIRALRTRRYYSWARRC
jgi:hypothetical protein